MHIKENNKPWFHNAHLTRHEIVTFNRCRADHYNLGASLARVKIINDPYCPCNSDFQDLNHILWNCPMYDTHRAIMLNKLLNSNNYPPYNIKPLLATCDKNVIKIICKFLHDCNLKI